MSAVSSIGKSWIEQADAFGEYLMGKTAEEVRKVETDSDGYAKDADLLSGCTIKVDGYREAVAAACAQAKAMGAAKGDSLPWGWRRQTSARPSRPQRTKTSCPG